VNINLNILIVTPIFFLILSNNVWSSNIQIDSTVKTIDVPIEIIKDDAFIIPTDLYYPDINSYNFSNLPDSIVWLLNLDLLNQKTNFNFLFNCSLSQQWRIKDPLTKYIQFQNGLALKSELGVFGEMLGQARNLTVVILAILHVIKYKNGLY
jgi:hypothetical protein